MTKIIPSKSKKDLFSSHTSGIIAFTMAQEPNITKIAFSIIRNPEATVEQAQKLHGLSDADVEKLERRISAIKATAQRMAQEAFASVSR